MKTLLVTVLLIFTFIVGFSQTKVKLYEYLYPRNDTMKFNCTYNSFHANGMHDTLYLDFKKFKVNNEDVYSIAQIDDTKALYSELAAFLGCAMIFRNDSILMAPLESGKSSLAITLKDFKYAIPPTLTTADTLSIKMHDRVINFSKFKFETLRIKDKRIANCLKIQFTVKYENLKKPLYSYVWLDKSYGIIKWIRDTGRTEIRDLEY
jgi:hypothetical protein